MLEMTRKRPTPPSLADPPDWLRDLPGFELFKLEPREEGWAIMPEGISPDIEFPGGTWRVQMFLPVDLGLLEGTVDPLVMLTLLANGFIQVEDKLDELVAHCRASDKSWTQIGQALGMTKQAAWERFSGED
jgi:hypothetical protein